MRWVVVEALIMSVLGCQAQRDEGAPLADASLQDARSESAESVDAAPAVAVGLSCTSCHGSDNPAPPPDLEGNTDTSAIGVGAHQIHLRGTSSARPVPCGECHIVPESVLDVGHIDGPPAEVVFSGAATAFGSQPAYVDGSCAETYCHGGRAADRNPSGAAVPVPRWTKVDGTQAFCGACHSLPPPAPHPDGPLVCADCHHDIAPDNATFVHPELHVDGRVTFVLPPAP